LTGGILRRLGIGELRSEVSDNGVVGLQRQWTTADQRLLNACGFQSYECLLQLTGVA